eukprot:TRINITY_DN620_c1_g3_i1.p1 TRINITY_DN620_c1_g3~~TRINITY_DN620_c1_g3_i1.p1  ORF type:complete len:219 (+),score=41.24 TRINITY_DN620_c1_g3_i1:125-781(+)
MVSSLSLLSCLEGDEPRTPPRSMTYARKFRTFQERRRALMGEVVEEITPIAMSHPTPTPARSHKNSSLLTALEAMDESKIPPSEETHYRELYEREQVRNAELLEYIRSQEASKVQLEQMIQKLLASRQSCAEQIKDKEEEGFSPVGLKPVITAFLSNESGKIIYSRDAGNTTPEAAAVRTSSPLSSPPSSQSSSSCRRPCNLSPEVKHCPLLSGRQAS